MNPLSFRKSQLQLTLKITLGVIFIYLAFAALDHGIHGLRYFQDISNRDIHALVLLTHIGTGFIALSLGALAILGRVKGQVFKSTSDDGKSLFPFGFY